MLSIVAIIYRPLYHKALFWLLITAILAIGHYRNWYSIDNHKYLMNYWCLAIFFSLLMPNPRKAMALNAKILIGLAFLFATIWKLISEDYLNGTFFHSALLLDGRFFSVANLFGAINVQTIEQNYNAFQTLLNYDSTHQIIQLQDTPQLGLLAQFLTWWTIILEAVIAITFLWPEGGVVSKWRDFPLLLFLISTYTIAPVTGFGWLLAIMGLTQAAPSFKYTRLLYIFAFLLVEFYLAPWRNIFERLPLFF